MVDMAKGSTMVIKNLRLAVPGAQINLITIIGECFSIN